MKETIQNAEFETLLEMIFLILTGDISDDVCNENIIEVENTDKSDTSKLYVDKTFHVVTSVSSC
ncbi:hypothetical protein RIR_e47161_A0A2N1M7W0_9GLOM [Rhizophagus irregularis DAOM 181602=DAOM 197198]|nr:hypothetical protein RIR_e47161_A0A2N1M7W0_9GLOM [Rhizophagus irregularis DAOM 181602=DAOM 197198]